MNQGFCTELGMIMVGLLPLIGVTEIGKLV